MKVVGIVFSPRQGGNTEILVTEALAGARKEGAETELLTIRDKEIKPCTGCMSCKKTGECTIKDDMQLFYKKLLEADGIIFGSPVYFCSMCGQGKVFIDRTYPLRLHFKLANKVGGAIAVAGRTGAVNTLLFFYRFFSGNHMFSSELVDGLAVEKNMIRKDERAMKCSWDMGRQVSLLIKQKSKFPAEFDRAIYYSSPYE